MPIIVMSDSIFSTATVEVAVGNGSLVGVVGDTGTGVPIALQLDKITNTKAANKQLQYIFLFSRTPL